MHLARHGQPVHVMSFTALQPDAGRLEFYGGLAGAMLLHLLNFRDTQGAPARRMSEIEIQLLNKTIEPLLDLYADCWREETPLRIYPEEQSSLAYGDSLYAATYNVTLAEGEGELVVVLRLSAWMDVLGQHVEEPPKLPQNLGMLGAIGDTTLNGRAILGNTHLSIGDYLSLRVGDVICLDQHADAPVEIQIGKRAKLSGQAHIENGKYVISVDRIPARGGE
jgi:flagellar motor switch protein FliM